MQNDFINCWLLAKDLPRIAKATEDPDLQQLCSLVQDNYKYPVDTVLISADLEVLGHKNANNAMGEGPRGYVAFLQGALDGEVAVDDGAARPVEHQHGPDPETVKRREVSLTPAAPHAHLLDVIHHSLPGMGGLTVFQLDTSAFVDGGTLHISLAVGSGPAEGSFALFGEGQDFMGQVPRPLADAHQVAFGEPQVLHHTFARGQVFQFVAASGPGTPPGTANAFSATVSVTGN